MTTTQITAPAAPIHEYTRRDKYGRTVRHFEQNCRTLAVMVTMPKTFRERYGYSHMVNVWAAPTDANGRTPVRDFTTRREAYAWAATEAARYAA